MIMYVVLANEKNESGMDCLPAFNTLAQAEDYVLDQGKFLPVLALDANGKNLLADKTESP